MQFSDPLFTGTFLRRYKRFFAEIEYQREKIVAHVPNTGSMKGLIESPRPCRFTFCDNPKRTLKYTLQMLKCDGHWVGINTHLPNGLAREAFTNGVIEHWRAYENLRSEVKISAESRVDLVLEGPTGLRYVEIKNVTLADGASGIHKLALFPDAKTERGQKHLRDLLRLKQQGHEAEILFVVQRTDCDRFSPARDIDPVYAELLKDVAKKGVVVSAYPVEFLPDGVRLVPRQLDILF